MNFEEIFGHFPEYELSTCNLRRILESDASDLYVYYCNQKVHQYLDWCGPSSVGHAKDVIAHWNRGYASGRIIRFAISDKETERIIGTIFLNGFEGKRAEVGYELSEEYWRRGIMSEALSKIVEVGLDGLGRNRIQALVCCSNYASENLLIKKGFRFEGLLRNYETHCVSNLTKDMKMYALVI